MAASNFGAHSTVDPFYVPFASFGVVPRSIHHRWERSRRHPLHVIRRLLRLPVGPAAQRHPRSDRWTDRDLSHWYRWIPGKGIDPERVRSRTRGGKASCVDQSDCANRRLGWRNRRRRRHVAWTRCDSIVRWGERQGEQPRRERTPVHVDVGHPRRWEDNHALLFVGRPRTTRIPLVPWPSTSLAGVPAVPSRILPNPATICFVHLRLTRLDRCRGATHRHRSTLHPSSSGRRETGRSRWHPSVRPFYPSG